MNPNNNEWSYERFEHDVFNPQSGHSTCPNENLTIVISYDNDDQICDYVDIHGKNQEAIADKICRAVNTHDDLIKHLEALLNCSDWLYPQGRLQIQQLLKKAKGE